MEHIEEHQEDMEQERANRLATLFKNAPLYFLGSFDTITITVRYDDGMELTAKIDYA